MLSNPCFPPLWKAHYSCGNLFHLLATLCVTHFGFPIIISPIPLIWTPTQEISAIFMSQSIENERMDFQISLQWSPILLRQFPEGAGICTCFWEQPNDAMTVMVSSMTDKRCPAHVKHTYGEWERAWFLMTRIFGFVTESEGCLCWCHLGFGIHLAHTGQSGTLISGASEQTFPDSNRLRPLWEPSRSISHL